MILYPVILRTAAKDLGRRPLPEDFSVGARIFIQGKLSECIQTVETRLRRTTMGQRPLVKVLAELQDHYVEFSIALGADAEIPLEM